MQSRGYFVSGKFDQYKRNLPYSAVVQALAELVTQLLSEDEKQLARWKERLLAALGPNAKVVTDVIPNLELIIGTPAPVPELPPAEGRNRFIQVFRDLIRVFARRGAPARAFPRRLAVDGLRIAVAARGARDRPRHALRAAHRRVPRTPRSIRAIRCG